MSNNRAMKVLHPVTDFPNPNKRKHDENDTQRKKLKTDINERQLNYKAK